MEELKEMIPKHPHMFDEILGQGCGHRWLDYEWRDVALYNIAVGCTRDDLNYVFEKAKGGFKAIPTFGVIPYINTILIKPPTKEPYGPNEILVNFIAKGLGVQFPNRLHMAEEIIFHKPINAMGGTFLIEDFVEKVYDWGDRGVVGIMREEVMDRGGNPVCTLNGTHWHKAFGNFGGEKFVSPKVEFPDREPDYHLVEFLPANTALLYRLVGDTYQVHIDPEVSGRRGYEHPFMQGLGTLGYATRMLIMAIIPTEPERVTRVYGQMRKVCVPGQNVHLKAWKLREGVIHYRLEQDNGDVLLGNGVLEYKA